ncbi:hemerythrin domain-containing protein [Rhodoferax sp. UBA5149]|uniref:hemerythrin domain-containing protein n=1 Tax=Rhodoferax sp. UBA5149 TaxID=1947379 RepID=UPI0025D8B460|nr:hemerythrin domain-containing protein [Rhodoferax sp. UBA5149]
MKTIAKNTTMRAVAPKTHDATALLHSDHVLVSGLLAQYDKTRSNPKKKELVAQICAELTVHAQIEEEIFYPAVKHALKDKALVPEATVEHATLKELISQVEGVQPDGEMFDAKIKVLSEYVKHHVKEEEDEMFPKAKSTKLDMAELGAQLAGRKRYLVAQRA